MIVASPGLATGAELRPDGRTDDLRERWRRLGGSPSALADLVKSELRRRFSEGRRPAVADFLDALPELREDSERMLSLIYEEFCLREEAGEAPSPDSFCERYAPWRDSLASQLNYHRMLSQAVGVLPGTPPRFPEPGEHFLRYRLRSVLGQGGAARVFLADDEDLGGRPSALKVSPDRGEEPSIMGRLQHPHIMPVHNVVRDPESGLRGLCMPYHPGRPLDQVIRRMENIPAPARSPRTLLDAAAPEDLAARVEGPGWQGFPRRGTYPEACAWLALTLADALAHSHALGILHRDVKPANVLLSSVDGPQLLDFNLAHDPHAPERAESALRGGTLPYMAPEQLEAFRDPDRWDLVGPPAECYALGLVLRELLTGRRPEAPGAEVPLPRAINDLLAMRAEGWPPARRRNPEVPHALEAILSRCIAHDPSARYASASDLAEDIHAFLRHRPLAHARNPNRRERAWNWYLRNRFGIAGLGLLAVVPAIAHLSTRETAKHAPTYVTHGKIKTVQAAEASTTPRARAALLAEAKRDFTRALELDPTHPRATFGLGVVSTREGDFPRAVDRLSRAIELAEGDHAFRPPTLGRVAGFWLDAAADLAEGPAGPVRLVPEAAQLTRGERRVHLATIAEMYTCRAEAILRQYPPNLPQDATALRSARADLEHAERLLSIRPFSIEGMVRRAEREILRDRIRYWSARERMGRALLVPDAMDRRLLEQAKDLLEPVVQSGTLDQLEYYGVRGFHRNLDRLLGGSADRRRDDS
ncbi:serine/threonine-protein kinase [Tautonia plasticadhaerens]|uniref:Serine/threonine-protein kinase PrkC n=1 Tax=Tautonia plasticadhaerens TaxID=2527974 RepID=A0A518GXH0_9BACT|nr:serine/threonine-protein kinase [Tautonia plasticadhaerens]QDV33281.1 Serine/threonine-protein kinase PrkC [Tautonia plasticadhaerens]